MMQGLLGLAIDGLVAVLLVLTIAYCWLLNRRLLKLRADETALKATIAELIAATEIAERSIAGLKVAVTDCEKTLGQRLKSADVAVVDLGNQIKAGETVLNRIALITEAARRQPALAAEPMQAQTVYVAPAHAPMAFAVPQSMAPQQVFVQQPVVSPGAQARATAAAADALAARARLRAAQEAA